MVLNRHRLIFYLFIGCLVCCVSACAQTSAQEPQWSTRSLTVQSRQASAESGPSVDVPVRLRIPAIQLDTLVEAVGILANGELDTPRQKPWDDVGWYDSGVSPGQRGSAVIDGHLDRPGGMPAVFWYLHTIHVADEVTVLMHSGQVLHFHVRQTALYAPQDAPLQGIFGDTSGSYLSLITCAGDWVPSQHQTTLRMVIYTSLG